MSPAEAPARFGKTSIKSSYSGGIKNAGFIQTFGDNAIADNVTAQGYPCFPEIIEQQPALYPAGCFVASGLLLF